MDLTDSNKLNLQLTKFNDGPRDCFPLWKMTMRAAFRTKKCLKIVTGEKTRPADDDAAALTSFEDRKDKASALLVMALGTKALKVIQAFEDDPHAAWKALDARYASKSTSTMHLLLHEAFNVEFKASTPVAEHISDL